VNRKVVTLSAGAAFVASIYFANWLVNRYGPIRVWPTDLLAPAGVYVVGVAFLLRDLCQRFGGQVYAVALVGVGSAVSVFVSTTLAGASAAAFASSELIGLLLFWLLGGNRGGPGRVGVAVVASSAVAAAVDSAVFLWIAFHSEAFFEGQWIAKVSVVVLAIPFVLASRRALPSPAYRAA
jgi:uncharacterized PurR-regulated membrane protein YhhQ (DUF165 family)